jgi:uncharacterized protein (TIGR03067 family)
VVAAPPDGVWRVESSTAERDSGPAFVSVVGKDVIIHNNVMSVPLAWGTEKKAIRLGPPADPRQIDLIQLPGSKGWDRTGIYRIDGERITLCVDYPNRPRPTKFEKGDPDNGGEGQEVVVLVRVRDQPKPSPSTTRAAGS